MSAAAELGKYAGGGQVLTEANKVEHADPGAITAAATRLSTAASDLGTDGGEVAKSVTVLDDAWEGTSADQFVAYMGKFGKAGTDIGQSMTDAAGALTKVAEALSSAQSYISGRCDQALTEIRNWIKKNSDVADQGQIDAFTTGVCNTVASDIRDHLKTTEATLSAAAGMLTGAETPASLFSTIPDPNTQAFTPHPGQPIQWTPTPPKDDQNTSPSGTTDQGPPPATSQNGGSGGSGSNGGGSNFGGGSGGGGGLGSSGGPPAGGPPPGNVQEWIKQAIEILRQNGINVSDADAQYIWQIIQHESGGNPHAINNWDCVPVDTAILTQRGWLKHDEVRVGDLTIGFNTATARSEWTPVERVVRHSDAQLVRISNSRWSATTTPNHRWINLPRVSPRRDDLPAVCQECGWRSRSRDRAQAGVAVHRAKVHGVVPAGQKQVHSTVASWTETTDLRSRDRILLTAPADTEGRLDITVREAALIGWIAGDGHVESRRHRPTMSIAQSKPEMVRKLRDLLADVPHAVYVDDRGGCGPRHQFRLNHDYATDLIGRAGHPKTDALGQVLAMSTEQRAAWFEAITDAEGTRAVRAGYTTPQVLVYQTPGPVLEAVTVATYLSGLRPRVSHVRRTGEPDWSPEAVVRANNPIVTGAFLRCEGAGRGDVWCVSTALGSWTAREGDHVFLTGNSNAAAGHPSKGLMQTIDSTFNGNKLPGHDDIWNPVDNIIAGVRYSIGRYGSLSNVPGIKAIHGGGSYVGY
jgi:uncharacterized protein YukE